jgi:hypothetical protein
LRRSSVKQLKCLKQFVLAHPVSCAWAGMVSGVCLTGGISLYSLLDPGPPPPIQTLIDSESIDLAFAEQEAQREAQEGEADLSSVFNAVNLGIIIITMAFGLLACGCGVSGSLICYHLMGQLRTQWSQHPWVRAKKVRAKKLPALALAPVPTAPIELEIFPYGALAKSSRGTHKPSPSHKPSPWPLTLEPLDLESARPQAALAPATQAFLALPPVVPSSQLPPLALRPVKGSLLPPWFPPEQGSEKLEHKTSRAIPDRAIPDSLPQQPLSLVEEFDIRKRRPVSHLTSPPVYRPNQEDARNLNRGSIKKMR